MVEPNYSEEPIPEEPVNYVCEHVEHPFRGTEWYQSMWAVVAFIVVPWSACMGIGALIVWMTMR